MCHSTAAHCAEGIVRDLRCLLWLSAFSRVGSIDFSPCHGPENFVVAHLDEVIIQDAVLTALTHLEEYLREKWSQGLKSMSTDS